MGGGRPTQERTGCAVPGWRQVGSIRLCQHGRSLGDAADRSGQGAAGDDQPGVVRVDDQLGAVPPRGTLLSLSEMKRVLGVRRVAGGRLAVRVEPGLSVAELVRQSVDLMLSEIEDDRSDLYGHAASQVGRLAWGCGVRQEALSRSKAARF